MTDFILTLLFGWAGYYRFRNNQIGLGILYLLTAGVFCIGWFSDIFISINRSLIPYNNNKNDNFDKLIHNKNIPVKQNLIANPNNEKYSYDIVKEQNIIHECFLDTQLNYMRHKNTKTIIKLLTNFINNNIKTGFYLEYFYYPNMELDFFKKAITSYSFSLKDVENFFYQNYINNDIEVILTNVYDNDEIEYYKASDEAHYYLIPTTEEDDTSTIFSEENIVDGRFVVNTIYVNIVSDQILTTQTPYIILSM